MPFPIVGEGILVPPPTLLSPLHRKKVNRISIKVGQLLAPCDALAGEVAAGEVAAGEAVRRRLVGAVLNGE
jgi:hypothetical protein